MTFVPGPNHMEMASGVYFDLLNPDPADVRLSDIAHHLAQINRYTGACRRPLSVAEHAVLVADRLRSQGYDAATILAGLHHDDPEAYIGDVGRPLKLALRALYERIDSVIADALELPRSYDAGAVKAADDWALAAEAWHLMPSRGAGWFCWGLYNPDDPSNPSAVLRLLDDKGFDRDQWWPLRAHRTNAALFIDQHRRLTSRTIATEDGTDG